MSENLYADGRALKGECAAVQLVAYRTEPMPSPIRPGVISRKWMDATPAKYAYRCLPLTIANQHGWELTYARTFDVFWTGSSDPKSVRVIPRDDSEGALPFGLFGNGVITFKPGYLFRTGGAYNLWVSGPPNVAKDGIAPLTGIVETSWLPFTFTMNWIVTRPRTVIRFEQGEPFCFIFPVARGLVESVVPVIRELEDDPELRNQYGHWKELRRAYREDLERNAPRSEMRGRDPHYMRGTTAQGAYFGDVDQLFRLKLTSQFG